MKNNLFIYYFNNSIQNMVTYKIISSNLQENKTFTNICNLLKFRITKTAFNVSCLDFALDKPKQRNNAKNVAIIYLSKVQYFKQI